ncbi:unnamed protein product [Brassica oleracea var. botrytis]|uniref:Uncharacterized protein n=2 Tax=Brassica TaxID=3705 RepID=A0A3P6GFP4_BRAOL|nr:unnamed protein product [Brassica napus]VDD64340.1 unnamed protein product [Brassica oleracea]
MQEVAGERGGYLHGRGALDSDGLLYLKEQMEAEDDAERLLRRTEKPRFTEKGRRGSTDAKVNTVLNKQDRPKEQPGADPNDGKGTESKGQGNASSKGLLGLAYDSSDEED